jgi:uncharacterized protein with HEPN domain
MLPDKSDTIRLQHMLDAGRKALAFTRGKTRNELDQDEQLVLALVRLVEIIGEAASRISRELQSHSGSISWRDIINTRNRLIHAYFDVDLDVLWQIVSSDLQLLVNELERIMEDNSELDQHNLFPKQK